MAFKDYPVVGAIFMGIRPAIAVLIFSAAVRLGKVVDKTAYNIIIAAVSMVSISLLGIHPIAVIIATALIGITVGRGHIQNENAN